MMNWAKGNKTPTLPETPQQENTTILLRRGGAQLPSKAAIDCCYRESRKVRKPLCRPRWLGQLTRDLPQALRSFRIPLSSFIRFLDTTSSVRNISANTWSLGQSFRPGTGCQSSTLQIFHIWFIKTRTLLADSRAWLWGIEPGFLNPSSHPILHKTLFTTLQGLGCRGACL